MVQILLHLRPLIEKLRAHFDIAGQQIVGGDLDTRLLLCLARLFCDARGKHRAGASVVPHESTAHFRNMAVG